MLAEDKSRMAMMEAAKLAEDLRMEQDNTQRYEQERKMLESQVKDLQVRLFHCLFQFCFWPCKYDTTYCPPKAIGSNFPSCYC